MSWTSRWLALCLAAPIAGAGLGCPAPSAEGGSLDAGSDVGDGDAEGRQDGASGDGGTEPQLEPTGYCEAAAPLFCPFYLRCGRMEADDEAACEEAFVEACNANYEGRYVALAEAGLLTLREEGLVACGEHLAAVPCDDQLMDLEGPCSSVWQGTVSAGGACGFDVESFVCAPGTRCVLDLSLCGECKAVAELGDACGGETTCAAEARCVDGRCAPRVALGEPCSSLGECRAGSYCRDDRCQAPRIVGVGASCEGSLDRCRYMTSCIGGRCEAQSLWGGQCGPSASCASGYCGEDGTCQSFTAPGESCAEEPPECLGGCSDGRCAPLLSACLATSP